MTTTPTAVVVREQVTSPVAIFDLIRLAIEKEIPVETLEKLQAMHERAADRAAAAEFSQAVATFQATCPPIPKNQLVDYTTSSGARVRYSFAPLDHITRVIAPQLQAVGLSYTWDTAVKEKLFEIRCTLRHVNGHATSSVFSVPFESKAGMSEQQKYSAASQFGRRLSLINVLGLTTTGDPETEDANPATITEEQATDLEAVIQEVGANKARFLQWAGVKTVAEVRAINYDACLKALRRHVKKAGEKAP